MIEETFLAVGITEDDFEALTQERASKYMEKYKMPEIFAYLNGKLVAVPVGKSLEKEIGKKQQGKIEKAMKKQKGESRS